MEAPQPEVDRYTARKQARQRVGVADGFDPIEVTRSMQHALGLADASTITVNRGTLDRDGLDAYPSISFSEVDLAQLQSVLASSPELASWTLDRDPKSPETIRLVPEQAVRFRDAYRAPLREKYQQASPARKRVMRSKAAGLARDLDFRVKERAAMRPYRQDMLDDLGRFGDRIEAEQRVAHAVAPDVAVAAGDVEVSPLTPARPSLDSMDEPTQELPATPAVDIHIPSPSEVSRYGR